VTRAALALLLLSSCARHGRGPLVAEAPLAERLLTASRELLEGRDDGGGVDDGARALERLARTARAALDRHGAEPPIEVLNRVVFEDEGFVREVDDTDLAFVLLPSVLRGKRGSCVGLGTLYLALGDLLHVPMRGVVLPGHFFVRAEDRGTWRNVELLRSGEQHAADWYQARWPTPDTTTPVYDRALTDDEVVGVIEYDIGNDLRRRGRVADARRTFERAVQHFPTFPEGQASLGAMLHLEGSLDAAAAAYEAARKVAPRLPGLERNLRALQLEEAERRDAATAGTATRTR
jgi:tetratricopeptide (TPR) repeat protein